MNPLSILSPSTKTWIAHSLIATLLVGLAYPVSPWLGCIFTIGFYLGREHAQIEYKYFRYGKENTLKPWQGFQGWSKDNLLDFLCPTVTAIVLCIILQG